jgi:hypothetical protein
LSDQEWANKEASNEWLKALAVTLTVVVVLAIGAGAYFDVRYHDFKRSYSAISTDYEDRNGTIGIQDYELSTLSAELGLQDQVTLLSDRQISLDNSSALLLDFNATNAGYVSVTGNGTLQDVWLVACYGATSFSACQHSEDSGSGYALIPFTSGAEVPVLPGPMVVDVSSDQRAQLTLSCVAYA